MDKAEHLGGSALRALDGALAKVENVLAAISGLTIFFLMMFAIANIAMRKMSDFMLWLAPAAKPNWLNPIFGYIDVVELVMVLFAVLCISYTQRLGGHVRMEILLSAMRGRSIWIVEALTTLAAIAIIAILMRYSINYALDAYNIGDSTIDAELPTWPAKMVVPFAFTILLARLLLQLWGFMRLIVDPSLQPVGVPVLENVEEQARHEIEGAGVLPDAAEKG